MKPKIIHYAGRLEWTTKRGSHNTVLAGWAACCSGRRAEAIRRERNHTYDPKLVTCKDCLQRLAWASGVIELTPSEKLERAEQYIAALEEYIERQNTCVVCASCLIPRNDPPYCGDTCRPNEEQGISWEEEYLEDPVKQLRAKHGRPA